MESTTANLSEQPAVEVTSANVTVLHSSCHPSRLGIPVPWETMKLGGLAQAVSTDMVCPSRGAARIFGPVLPFSLTVRRLPSWPLASMAAL